MPSRAHLRARRRVSVREASLLQGFRADYPWLGSRSRHFRQIGNSVCPPLARRVVEEAARSSRRRGGGEK